MYFRYVVTFEDTIAGCHKTAYARFIIVTTGILGLQYTQQERGYKGMELFQGVLTLAGRHEGKDSLIGGMDCTNKVCAICHCLQMAPGTH